MSDRALIPGDEIDKAIGAREDDALLSAPVVSVDRLRDIRASLELEARGVAVTDEEERAIVDMALAYKGLIGPARAAYEALVTDRIGCNGIANLDLAERIAAQLRVALEGCA